MTAALVEMDEEIENVRAAWAWACERGQLERLDQGADGLGFYCSVHWRRREAIADFQMAATSLAETRHVRALPDGYRRRVLANTLVWLAYFHNAGGSYERASQLSEQSLGLLDVPEHALRSGDLKPSEDVRHERAFALAVKAQSVAHVDPRTAMQLHEQSLALYRALGDQWRIARQLFLLAYIARHLGDYGEANDLFRQSLEIGKAIGDQSGVAFALHGLTSMALRQGEYEEGARWVQECIVIRGEIGDRMGVAHDLGLSSRVLMALGKYEEAHRTLKAVIEMWDDLGARYGTYPAWWEGWLGFAALHLGNYSQAREQAQLIRAVYQEHSTPWGIAWSLSLLASLALVEGDPAAALELLEQGTGLNRGVGQRDRLAADFGLMAFAARERGHLGRAKRYLLDACRTAVEIGNQRQLEELLPVLALLSADQGEPERAVELYALAKRYPSVAESLWYEEVAGKHITILAATLPPDVVEAARRRGRALDLEATIAEYLTQGQAPS